MEADWRFGDWDVRWPVGNISDCIVLGAEAAELGWQGCCDCLALQARLIETGLGHQRKHFEGFDGPMQGCHDENCAAVEHLLGSKLLTLSKWACARN
jgi:hypothetical protein